MNKPEFPLTDNQISYFGDLIPKMRAQLQHRIQDCEDRATDAAQAIVNWQELHLGEQPTAPEFTAYENASDQTIFESKLQAQIYACQLEAVDRFLADGSASNEEWVVWLFDVLEYWDDASPTRVDYTPRP
jgi:hypothetical protein